MVLETHMKLDVTAGFFEKKKLSPKWGKRAKK